MNFVEAINYFGLSSFFTYKELESAYLKKINDIKYNEKEQWEKMCLTFLYLIPRMIRTYEPKSGRKLNYEDLDSILNQIVNKLKSHEFYSNLSDDIYRIKDEELEYYKSKNMQGFELINIFKGRMKDLFYGEYKRYNLEKLFEIASTLNDEDIMKNILKLFIDSLYIDEIEKFDERYTEVEKKIGTFLNNNKAINNAKKPDLLFINKKTKMFALLLENNGDSTLVCFNGQNFYEENIDVLNNEDYMLLRDFLLESECICCNDITYHGSYTVLYKNSNISLCHTSAHGFFIQNFSSSVIFEDLKQNPAFEECKDVDKCLALIETDLKNRLNNLKRN